MSQDIYNIGTTGPTSANLIQRLVESGKTTFRIPDAKAITGLSDGSVRTLLHKAERRHLISRLKPGLFAVVPLEQRSSPSYSVAPYRLAKEVMGSNSWYLSHATALELHRMTTQPNFTVFVTCTKQMRTQTIGGYPFKFHKSRLEDMFGVTDEWVEKDLNVTVSDREKTVIDGLRTPGLCGGITEVAKGLWMAHEKISVPTLVAYAKRMNVGSVYRRLGFLLETYKLADNGQLEELHSHLTATYQLLDPIMDNHGRHNSRWRLRVNVDPAELDALRWT